MMENELTLVFLDARLPEGEQYKSRKEICIELDSPRPHTRREQMILLTKLRLEDTHWFCEPCQRWNLKENLCFCGRRL